MEINTLKDVNKDFEYKQAVDYSNLDGKDLIVITKSLDGTSAATAGNYGVIFNTRTAFQVVFVAVSWQVASTSGTLNLERLSGTEALDAGDTILVSNIDMSTTANTFTEKKGKDLQNTTLKYGDRLALKDGGTLTNQAGVCITIYLRPLGRGNYG